MHNSNFQFSLLYFYLSFRIFSFLLLFMLKGHAAAGSDVNMHKMMLGSNSPFGAKPTQVCVFASKLATPHIVFG